MPENTHVFATKQDRSNFKGSGAQNFIRRFLQALRETLRTWAQLAQIFEGVNPGAVTVTPFKLQCIVADGRYADPLRGRWDIPVTDLALTGKLLDTAGAHAVFTKIPGGIGAEVSVVPGYISAEWANPLHQSRSQIRHACSFQGRKSQVAGRKRI